MSIWTNVIAPLLPVAVTIIGGYLLVTRTQIKSANVIQSRLEWLKNIKQKFSSINDILIDTLFKINNNEESKEGLLSDNLHELDKSINNLSQDFKPYNFPEDEDYIYKICDSIIPDNFLIENLNDVYLLLRQYDDSAAIKVKIPNYKESEENNKKVITYHLEDEDIEEKHIDSNKLAYNYFVYRLQIITEIQKTISKLEWEKIKQESFIKKTSSYNQDILTSNLFHLYTQISNDFTKNFSTESTVYEILSEAIEYVESSKKKLPSSMPTTSGKRYIYTDDSNKVHPNGKNFFNAKTYKGKERTYYIETNYSKEYALKYAKIIKKYGK